MSPRAAAWLAWLLWGFSALFAATALAIIAQSAVREVSFTEFGAALNALAMAAAFSTVGAVVASRRSENPIGWIMCAIGLLFASSGLGDSYAVYALNGGSEQMPGAAFAAWASTTTSTTVILAFPLLLLLFPDGRLPSRRWWPVVWLVVFVLVAEGTSSALLTERFVGYGDISNPFHIAALDPLGDAYATYAQTSLSILALLLPTIGLVMRFWRSRGIERQQLKWFVCAGALAAFGGVLIFGERQSQILLTIYFVFTTAALCAIPISMGVAILRYRLYDIDVIINRTLVYGSLTATLALVYMGSVVSLQALLRALTGQESTLAVVASTLAIAALFNPLRRRVQGFVDRRFYRRKYDAAKTLAAFNARLRDETDLDTLGRDLMGVVRDAIQPEHVSLWLRSDTASRSQQTD